MATFSALSLRIPQRFEMERNIMSSIGVNKVILLGNAGQDVEVRSTSAGKSVANFSLAINQSFRDKKEGNVQRVEWVRCVAWGKLAEIAERFVTKGKQVFVEGRLQTRRFEDREGSPKTVRVKRSPSERPRTRSKSFNREPPRSQRSHRRAL